MTESIQKIFKNPALHRLFRLIKPWASVLIVFLILRYTGAIAGLSVLTQQVLLKTGAMDADGTELAVKKDFDYNFSVHDLDGKAVDMKVFKGKTIFLNLWATWCGPCRAEMPSIEELSKKVDRDKIAMVILSLDRQQDKSKVVKFVQDKAYTFPVYVLSEDLPESLQVSSIPTTFVISPDGKVVSKKVGANNYDTPEFLKYLNSLNTGK